MAARGQLIAPKLPLRITHELVMKRIDAWEEPVGVFLVGGQIFCMRRAAPGFNKRSKVLANQLVGVYDDGIDSRVVMADLKTFYPIS